MKLPAKQIGLGDVYLATEGDWLVLGDPVIAGLLKRVRAEGVLAMNETTLAQIVKKVRKKTFVGKGSGPNTTKLAMTKNGATSSVK